MKEEEGMEESQMSNEAESVKCADQISLLKIEKRKANFKEKNQAIIQPPTHLSASQLSL